MPRPGEIIAVVVFALLALGVVMVHSAGMGVATVSAQSPTADSAVTFQTIVLSRSSLYAGVALAALLIGVAMPVRRLAECFARPPSPRMPRIARREFYLLIAGGLTLAAILLLVYVPGLGRQINGAHRWIGLPLRPPSAPPGVARGGVTFQPSELAKWGAVVLVAWWAGRRRDRLGLFWLGLVPPLVVVGAIVGVITLEDLGTAVLITAVTGLVLLAAGAKIWHMALFIPPALAAFAAACWLSPYRMQRLITFLNPYADPQDSGYHIIQSLSAIAGAGPFGRGLGHGLQKFGYLPEDTTDFLYAIVCEELGLAGAAAVCFAYVLLVWTTLSVAQREQEPALRALVIGVAATVGLQAAMNLLVVTGLAPTKGIALPLMSSGGTGWILTAGALGLVIAVDRTQARAEHASMDALPKPSVA